MDLKKVAEFARGAETEDLLDRVTVYRGELEPEALQVIEEELGRRGCRPEAVRTHAEARAREGVLREGDTVVRCTFCFRPAVSRGRGWYRLLGGWVPVWPRTVCYCPDHKPAW